jgi:hypothetical protein
MLALRRDCWRFDQSMSDPSLLGLRVQGSVGGWKISLWGSPQTGVPNFGALCHGADAPDHADPVASCSSRKRCESPALKRAPSRSFAIRLEVPLNRRLPPSENEAIPEATANMRNSELEPRFGQVNY